MDSTQKIYVIYYLSLSILGLVGLIIFHYLYFDLYSIIFSIIFLILGIVCALIFLFKKPPAISLLSVLLPCIFGIILLILSIIFPIALYYLYGSVILLSLGGFRVYVYIKQQRTKKSGNACEEIKNRLEKN